MRHVIAIVCLSIFFTMQYGKLVSYWRCKINAAVSAVHCDCEKIMNHTAHSAVGHPATMIAQEKLEEVYVLHGVHTLNKPQIVIIHNNFPSFTDALPEGRTIAVFQPPRS